MAKINLTEEELLSLMDALNAGVEPFPELMGKLFPSFMEKLTQEGKFDFETLNRIRIPSIEYAGKRPEGVILASAVALGQSAPLQVVRSFGEVGKGGWQNLIIQGDNLQFLKTVYLNQDPLVKNKIKGQVKLIYIDPPFATKSDFKGGEGGKSYSDKIEGSEFIENLRERIVFLRELMSADGSIYLHLDTKKGHYMKVVMDEIFGDFNFKNEIIWKRTSAHSDSKTYANVHDCILYYTKSENGNFYQQYTEYSDEHVAKRYKHLDPDGRRFADDNLIGAGLKGGGYLYEWKGVTKIWRCPIKTMLQYEKDKRLYYTNKGVVRIKRYIDELQGQPVMDMWLDIFPVNSQAVERINFPTQKPESLLERIIKTSTNPDDLIMDVFGGSGTTAAVAEKLGRRWIVCDFGKHAIYTTQKRLLNIADSKAFDAPQKNAKYEQPPKPFAVASVGAYDFSRVMNLRESKETYISFVLALFGIPHEAEKDFIGKFKLDHIYAEKDGDPVEIFPVWDDEYLYNVRIDQDYLKDIITQSRGRLKGNFHIIVPESCTQISDIQLPNGTGGEVQFRFLKFPYSILEQAARNFAIEEQPDTISNINNLISSVGFYFNDEVKVQVVKSANGLSIVDFSTPILNREKAPYEGLAGLSLLLIDLNYNGKVFNMDSAIYSKDIIGNGKIELSGVNSKTAVIAIDRHGNESPPTLVRE